MQSFKSYFLMMAHYNQWANQCMFALMQTLTPEQLQQDCAAFFYDVIHTANHLLVGDILWMQRISSAQSKADYALNEVLYPNIATLTTARQQQDLDLILWIQNQPLTAFAQEIQYERRGQQYTEPLCEILAHVFNHQSHHRGQLHSMLFQLTGQSLELDLIYFQRAHAARYRNNDL